MLRVTNGEKSDCSRGMVREFIKGKRLTEQVGSTEPSRGCPIRSCVLTLLLGDWAGLSSLLSMERPFLSVSLPGGNPQHKVTYK